MGLHRVGDKQVPKLKHKVHEPSSTPYFHENHKYAPPKDMNPGGEDENGNS